MKKILFIFIIIISYNIILSQNLVDPPKLSNFTNINTNIYDVSFNNNNFILGWNWGSAGLALDQALNINYYHDYYFTNSWFNQNAYLGSSNFIAGHRKATDLYSVASGHSNTNLAILNAQAQLLSPLITVDSTEKFISLPNDNMGGVFGFKTKNNGYQDGNYWILDNNILPNTMVLSNIWKNNILKYWNC